MQATRTILVSFAVATLVAACGKKGEDGPPTGATDPSPAPTAPADPAPAEPEPAAKPAEAQAKAAGGADDVAECERLVARIVECGAEASFVEAATADGPHPADVFREDLQTMKTYGPTRICTEWKRDPEEPGGWPFSDLVGWTSDDIRALEAAGGLGCDALAKLFADQGAPLLLGD